MSELVEKILVIALSLVVLATMAPSTLTEAAQLMYENRRLQLARALVDELDYGIIQVASGRAESYSKDVVYPDQTSIRASGFTLTVECLAFGRTFTEKRAYSTQLSIKSPPQPGSRIIRIERADSKVQISLE